MDFTALPEGQPTTSIGGWNLWVLPTVDTSWAPVGAWQGAFVDLFKAAVAAVEDQWPLPEGVHAHVMLGGEQDALDWGVDGDALGFHALCSRQYDEESDEDFLDLPDDHRCYINVVQHAKAVADDVNDEASRLAALMTLPHEMGHLALFAIESGGRSPLAVFDQEGGEVGITNLLARIEEASHADLDSAHGQAEDLVETFASEVVDRWMELPASTTLVAQLKPFKPSRRRSFR